MAYGGPPMGAPAASTSSIRQVKLDKECELRIEVSAEAPLRLRLLNGTAEIFGNEIPPEVSDTEFLYKVCGSNQVSGTEFERKRDAAFDLVEKGVENGNGFFTGSVESVFYVLGQCEGDLGSGDI